MKVALMAVVLTATMARADEPLRLVGSIPLPRVTGRIDHMAADTAGKRLFVGALGNGTVEVIDLATSKPAGRIKGLHEPQGVGYVDEPARLIVACAGDGAVVAFDPESLKEVGRVRLGEDADNVRVRGSTAFVGYGDGAIAALDAGTLARQYDVKLSGHPESFQLAPDGGRVYVNIPGGVLGGGGTVVVVGTASRAVEATWKLEAAGRNFPMAVSADGARLYVGCRRPARLVVIDTATGRTVASPECVGDADDVFCDGDRVLVSGGDGLVDVFTRGAGEAYERRSIATASGARTSLLVGGRLYVPAPAHARDEARVMVFGPGPTGPADKR